MSLFSQFVGVSGAIQSNQIPLEILLVGGGGGGDNSLYGNGGSAGQVVWYKQYVITKGTTYSVVIGNGGNAGISTGGKTTFGSLIAYGANLGGSGDNIIPSIITDDYIQLSNPAPSGARDPNSAGRGGSGAGGVGGEMFVYVLSSGVLETWAGDGGAGYVTYITGISNSFAGGGGGNASDGPGSGRAGGGNSNFSAAANSGSGGGRTGAGGSGIVILAYPDTYTAPVSSVGITTLTTRPGYRVYRFTGATGSVTW